MNGPVCFSRNVRTLPEDAHSHFESDELSPRSHKRRRISTNSAILHRTASQPQLQHTPDLSVGYLPSPSLSDGVAADAGRTGCFDSAAVAAGRHVQSTMDPVLLGGIYDYSPVDNKLTIDTMNRPPSPVNDGLGPFHGQYWNFMHGNVNQSDAPTTSNGNYVSPYCASGVSYYSSSHPGTPVLADEQNGLHQVDGSVYGHHRGYSSSSHHSLHHDGGMYSHHGHGHGHGSMDSQSWQYHTVDSNLQIQSLHILDNLANQILSNMMSTTCQDFLTIASDPSNPRCQAYSTLQALFDQNKKVFGRDQMFLLPDAMQASNPSYVRTFRKANLASFVSCIFRGHDVPFLDLDEVFLDVFMPTGTRLLKSEGALFLELKTQAYIAIMLNSEASKEEVLDRLFPRDLQLSILRRRPEPTHLAPAEQDFIGRLNTRRQYLSSGTDNLESLSQLPHKYSWKDFLDEVYICTRRALESMDAMKDISAISPTAMSPLLPEDPITKATLAAHVAITGHHRRISSNPYASRSHTNSISPTLSSPIAGHKRTRSCTPLSMSSMTSPSHGYVMHPGLNGMNGHQPTSAPMTVQYEQARMTTHPKTTPFNRRTGAPSQRRPWTNEEEKALMDGLDRVKGPHWSQILAIYGAGGSISEVLKDRNQVQLKDKARNLKLFFLKSGIDVPVYLQRVTGELKTRAPAQAAKREAKERARLAEQAKNRDGQCGRLANGVGLGLALGDQMPLTALKQTKVGDGA